MLEVKKQIEIIITEEDVQMLKDVFEIARIHIHDLDRNYRGNILYSGGVQINQELRDFMQRVFDA